MDKNKVLPRIRTPGLPRWKARNAPHDAEEAYCRGFSIGADGQRDADWERVKGLIEDLEAIAHFRLNPSDTAALGLRGCQELARQALAGLEEKKP